MLTPLQVRIVGNACITRFNNGEGTTLSDIIAVNYAALDDPANTADRAAVVTYVASKRPDIPA